MKALRVDEELTSLILSIMAALNPVLIDVPMPIRTPRLLIRPKQVGDGASTFAAVAETWDELHKWMRWAENERLSQLNPWKSELAM